MVYVSHLCLYMQCIWYMCSLYVEEVASVFCICGVGLGCVVSMWRVYVWFVWKLCAICVECGNPV